MGRPLNKRFFGANAASNIKIQFNNGTASVPGYIVKQKGTRTFLCSSAAGVQSVCKLVAKASAALLPGEMSMSVELDSGTVEQVTKITAHKIVSASGEFPWNFSTSAVDGAVQIEEAGTTTTLTGATNLEGDVEA